MSNQILDRMRKQIAGDASVPPVAENERVRVIAYQNEMEGALRSVVGRARSVIEMQNVQEVTDRVLASLISPYLEGLFSQIVTRETNKLEEFVRAGEPDWAEVTTITSKGIAFCLGFVAGQASVKTPVPVAVPPSTPEEDPREGIERRDTFTVAA